MKTNPSFRIFKFSTLVPLGVAVVAALVTQPMRGSISTLVITENSSTSLTATLNNNPLMVTFSSADHWTIPTSQLGGAFSGTQVWQEPAPDTGLFNTVQGQPVFGIISVGSENISGLTGLPNNTADTTSFTLGTTPVSVTFNDLGDGAATAPDTGSTFGLLALALAALFGASRFRALRLA